MAELAVRPGEPSVFLGVAKQNEYYLANHEIQWDSALGAMTELSATRRNDAVFVTWPRKIGRWAKSPDEVVEMLRRETTIGRTTD